MEGMVKRFLTSTDETRTLERGRVCDSLASHWKWKKEFWSGKQTIISWSQRENPEPEGYACDQQERHIVYCVSLSYHETN